MSVGSYHKQSASSGLISLQLDPQALKGFQDFTRLVPKAAHAAQRRAVNKTLRWLRPRRPTSSCTCCRTAWSSHTA